MKAIGRFAGVFVALVIISGCGAQPWAPGSSPTGPGPGRGGGVGDPPVYGEITLKSVTHESGDTLLLQDCAVLRNQPAGQQLCNDQLRLTLEVAVDRDLQNLQLQVSFMEGDRRCGLASSFVFSASAHRLQSLTTSLVEFYGDQPEAGKPVDLGCHTPPLVTTRVTATLLDVNGTPGVPLLTKDLPYGYTFAVR